MIKGQQIYLGPRLHAYGIGYGFVFYNGVHPALELAIKNCPAIAELVVPIAQAGAVRRELNFDYAHNMRGQSGNLQLCIGQSKHGSAPKNKLRLPLM